MTQPQEAERYLTPRDVTDPDLPLSGFGRRGYDIDKVDAFRRHIARRVGGLLADRKVLQDQVKRLNRAPFSGAPGHDNSDVQEESHIQAVHILSKAQQTADKTVGSAQAWSRKLVEDAERHGGEILKAAEARADMIEQEARRRGEQAAASVPSGQPPLSSPERYLLEAEIARLRARFDVYRTHLRADLEGSLRAVDAWDESDSPVATDTAAEQARLSA